MYNTDKTNISDFANGAIGVTFKNNEGNTHVDLKKTMKNVPVIFLTPFGANPKHYNVSVFNVSKTGFDIYIYVDNVTDGSINVFWAAMTRNI